MNFGFLEGLKKKKEAETRLKKEPLARGQCQEGRYWFWALRKVEAEAENGKRDANNCWASDGALAGVGQLLTWAPNRFQQDNLIPKLGANPVREPYQRGMSGMKYYSCQWVCLKRQRKAASRLYFSRCVNILAQVVRRPFFKNVMEEGRYIYNLLDFYSNL